MAYCGQATQANANYLASKTGLDPRVALAWLKNECQSNPNPTNPLNILYYGTNGQVGKAGRFGVYSSPQAGLDAAARLVNGSAYYAGIRAAVKTGDAATQARAIENSPWAGGHYGGAGARDGNIVRTLGGIIGGIIKPVPSSSKPLPTPVGTPTSTPVGSSPLGTQLAAILKSMGLTDPAHIITPTEAQAIGRALGNQQLGHDLNGRAVSDILGQANATDPITAVANAIGAVGDLVGKIAGIGVGLVFVMLGVFLYSKGVRQRLVVEAA